MMVFVCLARQNPVWPGIPQICTVITHNKYYCRAPSTGYCVGDGTLGNNTMLESLLISLPVPCSRSLC